MGCALSDLLLNTYVKTMDSDNIAQLAYLALLGTAVVAWFFAQNTQSLGKTTQQALIWVLIFVGVIAGVGLWGDLKHTIAPSVTQPTEDSIEIPRSINGHYEITMMVNGVPVDFLVDTGASQIVLAPKDAHKVGFDVENLRYTGQAQTANGVVATAEVILDDIKFGTLSARGIRAWVNQSDMDESLLGMTYLNRFGSIEIRNDTMILTR